MKNNVGRRQILHARPIRVFVVAVATALTIGASLAATAPAVAATLSGTYYVDNSSGSCSDSGPGSSTAPWCTFGPANSNTFAAGSQLLLKRGDTFQQALKPTGVGTSSAWITIGAYGTGSRPIIKGSGVASDRTIVLTNPDYWRVQDVELSTAGEGILVNYTTTGHQGLDFERVYAHDIQTIFHGSPAQSDDPRLYNSAAITVDIGGAPSPSAGSSVISGITIRNLEATNTAAIYLVGTATGASYPTQPASAISDVFVSEVYAHASKAPFFAFEPTSNLHFVSSYVDCSGHVAESQGTTCNFVYDVSDAVFANNVFINMNNTGSHDETALDIEGVTDNIRVSGNYFGNNAGAGIEYLNFANGGSGGANTNNMVDGNTFYNNGGAAGSQLGQIAIYASSGTPASGTISNNVYASSPNGFLSSASGSAASSLFTVTGNTAVTAENASAMQFTSTQGSKGWRQQGYTGSGGWADLPTFNSGVNQWEASDGAFVGNFELQAGSSNLWVARTWTASSSGTVHIRGQVFKDATGGDGVKALIERNGAAIWPSSPDYLTYKSLPAGDTNGFATDVDQTVNAGDIIRFVVFAGPSHDVSGDLVSWIPSISY